MKLNRKGFTLIELLAVITILGILMIVGIPAVQRTINNSRKDTFTDTAKEYANAVKTAWAADDIKCGTDGTTFPSTASSLSSGTHYVYFASSDSLTNTNISAMTAGYADDNAAALIQSGGKSSWGSNDVAGYVAVTLNGNTNPQYAVLMIDSKGHGWETAINSDVIDRGSFKSGDNAVLTLPSGESVSVCKVDSN